MPVYKPVFSLKCENVHTFILNHNIDEYIPRLIISCSRRKHKMLCVCQVLPTYGGSSPPGHLLLHSEARAVLPLPQYREGGAGFLVISFILY